MWTQWTALASVHGTFLTRAVAVDSIADHRDDRSHLMDLLKEKCRLPCI